MPFSARALTLPTCVFAEGLSLVGPDSRFRGVKTHGPYDKSNVVKEPKILFVFPEEYKDFANDLFVGLRNGNSQFPGLSAMFGVSLSKASVARCDTFRTDNLSVSNAAKKYETAITAALTSSTHYDFAYVIVERTAHYEFPSPYYSSKAALAAHGLPSQVISTDVLRTKSQLTWSLANIALQTFVKLGGCPWFVKPSSGGGDIIVGIGRSERTDRSGKVTRFIGYTTAYTSGGVFKSVELFRPQSTMNDYLANFGESIFSALSNVAVGNEPVRLVLHVPKKFSKDEKVELEKALQKLNVDIAGYTVLRLAEEHPFHVMDFEHRSFAPPSGIVMSLDPRNCLAVFDGRPSEGNMRRPPASPLWVTMQASSTRDYELQALIQQAYDLSVANWRGFNAKAHPITVHYSKLLSRILSTIDEDETIKRITTQTKLSQVPWFI